MHMLNAGDAPGGRNYYTIFMSEMGPVRYVRHLELYALNSLPSILGLSQTIRDR